MHPCAGLSCGGLPSRVRWPPSPALSRLALPRRRRAECGAMGYPMGASSCRTPARRRPRRRRCLMSEQTASPPTLSPSFSVRHAQSPRYSFVLLAKRPPCIPPRRTHIKLCQASSGRHAHPLLAPRHAQVCILGFGRGADVYASKQKPKRLTIYCDDFRCDSRPARANPWDLFRSWGFHCQTTSRPRQSRVVFTRAGCWLH
jgi:hypothetical protein